MSVRRVQLMAPIAIALTLGAHLPLTAQVRGATQRQSRATQRQERAPQRRTDANTARQGRLLLDRFAARAAEALRLDDDQTRRLQRELQASREQRARLTAQSRVVRQELGHLIQESSSDESRIEALLDEAMQLEVAVAQIAVDEQRRLAEFLTPVQRARVIWLRQRLARQAAQRRDRPPSDGVPDSR